MMAVQRPLAFPPSLGPSLFWSWNLEVYVSEVHLDIVGMKNGGPQDQLSGLLLPSGSTDSGDRRLFCFVTVRPVSPSPPWPSCLVCRMSRCIPSAHTQSDSISTSPPPLSILLSHVHLAPRLAEGSRCSSGPQRRPAAPSGHPDPPPSGLCPPPAKATTLEGDKMLHNRVLKPTCRAFGE